MRTYWHTTGGLKTLDKWQPNCWVQVTCPTQEDKDFLENTLGIPDYFISDIADTDERARYEFDDGWVLIILRIPYVKEVRSRTPFTTIPLGIILNKDVCITVCNFETNMMIDFVSFQQKRGVGFTDSVDMVFRLFLSSSVWYLKRLKQINTLLEKSKENLDHKIDNAALINLSKLQDSLTYFITSIRGNETLLSKLKFKLPVDELDADLIEDVNIEMSQARESASIYANILDSTMDTYANIINNNMSSVMKMLTSITLLMMFPTLVASLFGMNLVNGMENSWWGFPLAMGITIGVTILLLWYFRRKTWI
ncbi:MAG: magnesium transporter CorA family protein [Bacteroidaceae bacterium]|jgi:magnesium transporter|nr:magnesium transporter CorA family protein [Bacteroidaceae bacterium]MBO5885906.1 magnesium transporter CorA family protein [Bacteroidaceae bacterium]MBO7171374.1 magnesium transporter CorA family protein [Bacteroidaceae bacterium]MBQ2456871.1 magnesium transporter CorA family protein [Bacteroidaceae bacterium]MBQ5372933.1 magnesium transporter CorA family protein [Bacteroidaceae bacterium]